MSKNLTILFSAMAGVGHVNACLGLAEVLKSRGHKIVFVVSSMWRGKLAHYGFHEEYLEQPQQEDKSKEEEAKKVQNLKPGEAGAVGLMQTGLTSSISSLEKMKIMLKASMFNGMIKNAILLEPQMKDIVDRHNPDVYIIDDFIGSPTLIYSNKPWVMLSSGNPLFYIDDERTPPANSGYPSNGDKNSDEWKEIRELDRKLFAEGSLIYNKWLEENGFPTVENRCIPDSPYLNLYGYPEELDYTDIRPIPEKWFQVDTFARKEEPQEFILPDNLKNRDEDKQKLIYFSLGSMGSGDVELMKRLVNILAKSPHKFIVSKGVFGDKYELPDNMWGQNSVPQINVLPLVDLVITHGGNNTLTETFSFGKPMIVMPLFADQFDNAQRVHEKGFGIRMDANTCTEDELLGAVEKLLNDKDLKDRLNAASKRISNSQSLVKAAQKIESLF